jgi:hypothetical protein
MDTGYHDLLLGCRPLRLVACCRSRAGGLTLAGRLKMGQRQIEPFDQPRLLPPGN